MNLETSDSQVLTGWTERRGNQARTWVQDREDRRDGEETLGYEEILLTSNRRRSSRVREEAKVHQECLESVGLEDEEVVLAGADRPVLPGTRVSWDTQAWQGCQEIEGTVDPLEPRGSRDRRAVAGSQVLPVFRVTRAAWHLLVGTS